MQEMWTRFECWLSANVPELLEALQPGATEEEIAHTESLLSVQFPDDFKAAYRIHNGQVSKEDGLIVGRELLSLRRIEEEWKVWKGLFDRGTFDEWVSEPTGPIREDWWNPLWIPITYDGSGNHDCLDLNPAEGGHIGQVIDFWHDEATREVKANSYEAWFTAFVEKCESGKYIYSEEYGGIADAEDL